MKLKTKIIFSIISIIMMMTLFVLVESGARVASSIVEKYIDDGADMENLELSLASSERAEYTYIISEYDGVYSSLCGTEKKNSEALSDLIAQIEADGARLIFDNVTADSEIALTKSVTISGRLSLSSGSINISAERLFIEECEITLDRGNVNVKSGKVRLTSGSVKSNFSSAFVLDYSSSARLEICGGEVTSASREAAILCKTGYLSVSGGVVSNQFGLAIEAESTVELSGNAEIVGFEYGVKTSKPVMLSGENGYLRQRVRVLYDSLFEKGCATTVFRDADSSHTEYIQLYDANGEAAELTYFEDLRGSTEKDFIAVYLPYEIKYYSGSSLFHTERVLKTDEVTAPESPSLEGYVFSGWYTDLQGKNPYIFGNTENSDVNLYASFKLTVPNFKINSKSFVYDGTERRLSFDELSHPLASGGSFSFEWYKDSEILQYSSDSIPLRYVKDSGVYNCKVTFAYNGDFVSVTTADISINITKACVEIPVISPCEYTGLRIYPIIPESDLYTFDFSPATDAGSYPVTFTLDDSDNYQWKLHEGACAVVNYEIVRSQNAFLGLPDAEDCFVGGIPEVTSSVKFGAPTVLYSHDGVSFDTDAPKEAGSYFLKIIVPETANYYYLESDIISFLVLEEIPVGIRLDKAPDKTDYQAFEALVLNGAEFSVTYNSGRVEKADIQNLTVKYKSGDCFLVSDTCAVIYYENVSVPVTVNVSAAEYDISSVIFDSCEAVYNGKRQTLTALGEVVGIDGIPLIIKVTGGGVNVGSYNVTLSFESDSINYRIPEPIVKTLRITPMSLSVKFGDSTFVYDGTQKAPTATVTGAEGSEVQLSVSGAAIDAGVYTARASISDSNYLLVDSEISFEIKRADIDVSSVSWQGGEFVYNGSLHSVTVSGLPPMLTLAGYTDSSFTDAGEYVATASVVYDSKNYNEPPVLMHKWSIKPAEYDFSECFFIDSEYIYDGNVHYPELSGEMPVGADGSIPVYSFSCGATHVSEGTVTVTVSFSTESKNYKIPSDLTVLVKILPKPINVVWGELNFVYDGNPHLPSAASEFCELQISGGATNAGNYTATAVTDNSDYLITNSEVGFVIAKGRNFWISPPVVGIQFEGKVPAPHAKAHYGEVVYSYYADIELKKPISPPVSVGIYYVVVSVPESENYVYLSHEPLEVAVIAIEPVELVVSFRQESLVAMNSLGAGDFYAYLLNNDGSQTELSAGDLKIKYENGASLLAKDRKITVSFGSFEKNLEITVAKASYDMSGAHWNVIDAVYTGETVFSYLSGLPSGVTVKNYVSNSGRLAGSYELLATLSYDAENYNEPSAPSGTLTVSRAEIPLPNLEPVFYDGTLKNIVFPEGAAYTSGFIGAIDAGVYEIYLLPKDSDNYMLAGGGVVSFEILRAPITLKVSDSGNKYSVISGSIFGDDVLYEEYYTEGGLTYIKIGNPNYDLTVIPAQSRESFKVMTVFFIILLIVLLLLGAFIIYTKREKIIAALAGKGKTSQPSSPTDVKTADAHTAPEAASPPEPKLELLLAVDEPHANSLISDSLAKNLLTDSETTVETEGKRKCIVNVDTISATFSAGDTVDINKMKERGIIPKDAKRVKVLARGVIDKPLTVKADSFSLAAVKMIALTGGKSVRVRSGYRARLKKLNNN